MEKLSVDTHRLILQGMRWHTMTWVGYSPITPHLLQCHTNIVARHHGEIARIHPWDSLLALWMLFKFVMFIGPDFVPVHYFRRLDYMIPMEPCGHTRKPWERMTGFPQLHGSVSVIALSLQQLKENQTPERQSSAVQCLPQSSAVQCSA